MRAPNRLDSLLRKRVVAVERDDIQRVNERMFLVVSDPEGGKDALRLLGAGEALASRLNAASARGIATAIRCEIPLIRFTTHLEALLSLDSARWRIAANTQVPGELKSLTAFCLQCAQDLALRNGVTAMLLFGVTAFTAERLADLAAQDHETLSGSERALIQIREADDLLWWDRLLIGERCTGPKALLFARYAGQQKLDMVRVSARG